MALRYRLLVLAALLVAGAASAAQAQRGVERPNRPPYGYFKYRIPRLSTPVAPQFRFRSDVALRARERAFERANQLRERRFVMQDRARERQFELQDRAWRRQFELRERSLNRLRDRQDRLFRFRPYLYHRHWRTI